MCNKYVFYFTSLGGGQGRGVEDHRHMVATIGWWVAEERCGGPLSHGSDNWMVGGQRKGVGDHRHMVVTIGGNASYNNG